MVMLVQMHSHVLINNSTQGKAMVRWLCASKVKKHILMCQGIHTPVFKVEKKNKGHITVHKCRVIRAASSFQLLFYSDFYRCIRLYILCF